jgi:hypothetical protein
MRSEDFPPWAPEFGTKFIYEITGNIDFREKLFIVRAIRFEIATTSEWFDKFESVLTDIDQNIRPERNRMIHDLLITRPNTPTSNCNGGSHDPSLACRLAGGSPAARADYPSGALAAQH